MCQSIIDRIATIIQDGLLEERWHCETLAKKLYNTLTISELEEIINEKRYEEKARKMIECDSRD